MPSGVYTRTPKRNKVIQPEDPNIRHIACSSDQIAIVDAFNYDALMTFNWAAVYMKQKRGYYAYKSFMVDGKYYAINMSHVVLMPPDKLTLIDHINGNGMDNRKENLRFATHSQNARNSLKKSRNTSGHKGVCFDPESGKWRARIMIDGGKRITLGRFKDIHEASEAYKVAAVKYHGEFARF